MRLEIVAEGAVPVPVLPVPLDGMNLVCAPVGALAEVQATGEPELSQVLVPEPLHGLDQLAGRLEAAQAERDVDHGLPGKPRHRGRAHVLDLDHQVSERRPDPGRLLGVLLRPVRVVRHDFDRLAGVAKRPDDLLEDVAGASIRPESGAAVDPCGRAVHHRDTAAGVQGLLRQAGHGMDLERRADHEQQPGPAGERERAVDRLGREQLVEEDDVRLQDGRATGTPRRPVTGLEQRDDLGKRVASAAHRAGRGADRPVHLDHVSAPSPLVKEVDVLGDDGLEQPELLEFSERPMGAIRLRLCQHGEARRVEAPDLLRVSPKGPQRRVLERVEPRPDSSRRAKVGHAALRRGPGAREGDARLVLDDQLREPSGRFCHDRTHSATDPRW